VQQVLPRGLVPLGGGEDRGNPIGGSIQGKYCVDMYVKKNMRPVETFQDWGRG
jgi:hypothetical protein